MKTNWWRKGSKQIIQHINVYLQEYLLASPRTEYEKGWNAAIRKMVADNNNCIEEVEELNKS